MRATVTEGVGFVARQSSLPGFIVLNLGGPRRPFEQQDCQVSGVSSEDSSTDFNHRRALLQLKLAI
jgi:hypothetical protein